MLNSTSIGLAGEFYALSLFKFLNFDAQLTFGTKKGCDLYLFGKNKKYVKIEVKSTIDENHKMGSYSPKEWLSKLTEDEKKETYFLLLFFKIEGKEEAHDFSCAYKYLVPAEKLDSWNDEPNKPNPKRFNENYLFDKQITGLKKTLEMSQTV